MLCLRDHDRLAPRTPLPCQVRPRGSRGPGPERWLDIGLHTNAPAEFTRLVPRQRSTLPLASFHGAPSGRGAVTVADVSADSRVDLAFALAFRQSIRPPIDPSLMP